VQIFLAILNFSPWLIAILFDLAFYIARRIWHEIPVYGGRARGERRPQAPNLTRGRRRRTLSLAGIMTSASPTAAREQISPTTSNGSIQEEKEDMKED
jgi:hypothetical protein